MNNTICAIATPIGQSGIGVIRLSGDEALLIASRILRASRDITALKGYQCLYGKLFDDSGEIDEVVATVFRAPHSYTGEEVVELSIHGGTYLLHRTLQACLTNGAVLAEAGEFTKRAFLNGKLDLTRAEAVMDLISSHGRQSAKAALSARDGALFRKSRVLAQQIIHESASLAAWIDYPEEDIEQVQRDSIMDCLTAAKKELEALLATYSAGCILREGLDTVIVGRPNVGKSTLMNLLSDCERSIVTEQAGTTRDIVTDTVRLGEVLLRLSDTAGMRETSDIVESAGVKKSEAAIEKAQLVLAIFDGSMELDENDLRVIDRCKGTTAIAVINKNDLPQALDKAVLGAAFAQIVELSAKNGDGAATLEAVITELFKLGTFDAGSAVLANERQRAAVGVAYDSISDALGAMRDGISLDAVGVCMEEAADALMQLTGEKAGPAVVNEIFSRFCVGK